MKSLVIVLLVLGLIMMALGYQKKLIQKMLLNTDLFRVVYMKTNLDQLI